MIEDAMQLFCVGKPQNPINLIWEQIRQISFAVNNRRIK